MRSHLPAIVVSLIALGVTGSPAQAQPAEIPPTVAVCRAVLDSAMRVAGKPAAGRPPDLFAGLRAARPCVDRLSLDSTPPEQLVSLALLYRSVGEARRAGTAIDRRLSDSRLTMPQRIEALRVALQI
ncbi:MAG: hypothetical protein ACR2M1_10155 [Gemmatimonadaceae bacterium]